MFDFHRERDKHFTRSGIAHENYKKRIIESFTSKDFYILVAEVNKAIVGYCLASIAKYPPFFEVENYGTIFDLVVTRDYRKEGIGENLLQEAYNWFSKKGTKRVEVRVATSNEVANKFWRKMGFTPYMEILYLEK